MERNGEKFEIVGPNFIAGSRAEKEASFWRRTRGMPILSIAFLAVIVLGCAFAEAVMNHDPGGFYLEHLHEPPGGAFYFGTDALGRDLFSIVWFGGRASLIIGVLAAAILTVIGVVYGCVSGTAPHWLDSLMMRTAEMIGSIPTLLLILLLLSVTGEQTVLSIAAVIGVTGWPNLARVVRGEVRQMQRAEYILAARCMGAGFFHIMRRHMIPNFVPAIMFMVVSSVGKSMMMESTLSFLGLGLPIDVVSWGSMLSLANQALLTNAWWVIVIPGAFMVATLVCITNIGEFLRKETNRKCSNL